MKAQHCNNLYDCLEPGEEQQICDSGQCSFLPNTLRARGLAHGAHATDMILGLEPKPQIEEVMSNVFV